jgi:hypothetical protein
MAKTWEEGFWDLFHIVKGMLLQMANCKENNKCGYEEDVRERIDNLITQLPKEKTDGNSN